MKRNLYVLIIAILLILSACAASYQHSDLSDVDPKCATGVTMNTVNVENNSNTGRLGSITAFIAHPNQGCDLPVQYCIFVKSGYAGGMSCTTINP